MVFIRLFFLFAREFPSPMILLGDHVQERLQPRPIKQLAAHGHAPAMILTLHATNKATIISVAAINACSREAN
jgi:hypothetical protein